MLKRSTDLRLIGGTCAPLCSLKYEMKMNSEAQVVPGSGGNV